ncbi:WD repeat-containing protein 89 [Phascolarctos cinereus]|uniref:WD repeat-containing protein 89 n=1 Tax=Phascolarctos cinereus TaxID=38626 RepID=A0A6P5KAZ3_PHACI|nr:WD repeat-containing protein 89 [Phascolarctos cinereus]XP_020842172.1 WD repeat-containing protein 89 [Phascolarctos cinereus]XP_020842173.1 WD repeat-containing protein 89 [Phascolarctos cinereus]XP_020842174.1 WD repeat-containing protein 89 [Phascolarctos cinereus]XP_020842175.1 WD repeat-containing protein 89 [Phascolarctos cinereus]
MEKIEEYFANLSIAKRSAVTKEPTYLLDIDTSKNVPEENGCIVAVSCSNGSVRLYNRETLSLLRELNGQPGLLKGVKFAHSCSHVFSACTDGTVKCWDMRLSGKTPVQVFKGYPSNVFISFDINCNDHIICAGTEKVGDDTLMVFWDARVSSQTTCPVKDPLGVYSETHSDDITQVCFHPDNPNMLVSGSTDGLVNVFDISIDNEEDALIATCNSGSSVSYVGWSGKEYKQIYCMTHDEGFCWWDLANLETDQPVTCLNIQDVREVINVQNGNLDYLVGGLYHEKTDQLLVVGGTNTGTIHLLNCGSSGLTYMRSLEGGHSATVRSFCWSVQDDSLLTGGEDAQLLLWKPGATERTLAKKDNMKIASSVQKRVRVHSNDSYKSKKKHSC